jgi:hypothetical protein
MNSRSKPLLTLILGAMISSVPAMAQTTTPDQTNNPNNPNATSPITPGQNGYNPGHNNYGYGGHHGFDWGWLGLLGLLGLAGRRRGAVSSTYDQTTTRDFRTGRDRAA